MSRSRVHRAAAAGLTAAVLLAAAPTATATPMPTATSVTCTTDARDPETAWRIAERRLAALARPPARGFPFGVTGEGAYVRTPATSWTSGFYPASLWLVYERTGDRTWLARARAYTRAVLPVASWTGTHDLGFMVGLPAGLASRLDPESGRRQEARSAIVTAARSLASRWDPEVGAMQSGTYAGRWGLIIDSAMNMPLLLDAAASIGGTEGALLRARALAHLGVLARDFVRADGTTVHRQAYDARTGDLLGPVTGQGLGLNSTWARGQAWAIAGFAQAYARAQEPFLLDAARRTADAWLARVPPGCVPAWDLDVTRAGAPRDSSAAAIAAYGIAQLAEVEPDAARASAYRAAATATSLALTSPTWVPATRGIRGVLQRQTWNVPADAREGSYAWGDTYLLLAWETTS